MSAITTNETPWRVVRHKRHKFTASTCNDLCLPGVAGQFAKNADELATADDVAVRC